MAAAIDRADPDGGVPSCPEWTVRDLVRHLGGVHRWATGYITSRRTEISQAELDEVVGSWPAGADVAGAACTVAGAAGDLFLALWNRSGADALTIEGDRRVLGQFAEAVQIR